MWICIILVSQKKETNEESKNIIEGTIAEYISNFIKIIIFRDLKNPINPFIRHKKYSNHFIC